MELNVAHNGEIPKNTAVVTQPPDTRRIDKCFRFYGRKFHLIGIPIGLVFVGIHLKFAIQYLGQCPIQPMINIYMIVHASVDLLLILLNIIAVINTRCIYGGTEHDNNISLARRLMLFTIIFTLIVTLFNFAWLIAGSVWVFGAKSNGIQGDSPTLSTYCQSDFYKAAVVLLIVNYAIHGLIILLVISRRTCCKKQ
ncbi:unnamed protein product [Adineta steineri]|uniref:Uncharacterized protein n=1 Tax=Adineta steineri TaxID=433720 RepID=A0A815UME4_9BILA|nr:unnamed protein product [Adineta steineri]CAF4057306.1 unnamed protein product [Adineta steineri]